MGKPFIFLCSRSLASSCLLTHTSLSMKRFATPLCGNSQKVVLFCSFFANCSKQNARTSLFFVISSGLLPRMGREQIDTGPTRNTQPPTDCKEDDALILKPCLCLMYPTKSNEAYSSSFLGICK
ncbi:hypothetical protein BKA57DRAFT_83959 [Linnemannia elongata]|nr:hypothetical protein BKA57DRAFT_83959 [Linnemannia elongata]